MKKLLSTIALFLLLTISAFPLVYTWDAPSTNTDGTPITDLTGYKFYYGTNITRVYSVTQDIGNTLLYTSSVTKGVMYIAVTAYNTNNNESDFSDELAVCLDYPAAPTINSLSYNFKTGKMTVSWTKPTLNENGTPITSPAGYVISYGKAPSSYSVTTNLPFSSTSAIITIPPNSGVWYFVMQTSNTWGNIGSKSIEWSSGSSLPSKPKNLRVIN